MGREKIKTPFYCNRIWSNKWGELLWLAKLFYPLLHKFAHSYYVASGLVCGPWKRSIVRPGQKGLFGLRNGPKLVFAWAGGHCGLRLEYGLFMGAWAMAEWLLGHMALGKGLGIGYIFIYRVWPKGRPGYMAWALLYMACWFGCGCMLYRYGYRCNR